jgi:hypothetical protein
LSLRWLTPTSFVTDTVAAATRLRRKPPLDRRIPFAMLANARRPGLFISWNKSRRRACKQMQTKFIYWVA